MQCFCCQLLQVLRAACRAASIYGNINKPNCEYFAAVSILQLTRTTIDNADWGQQQQVPNNIFIFIMSAIDLLTKAIELDVNGRHREALHLYQNGISELLQQCKAEPEGDRKRHLQKKIEEYVLRAEQIKKLLPPIAGALVTKLLIMKGDTGYDYQRVFGKYLTDAVTEVQLEDPYLRDHHQIMNLLRFCELVVLQCRNVKVIEVTTTREPRSEAEQATAYEKMAESLMMRKRVKLRVNYSETMHDRQIM